MRESQLKCGVHRSMNLPNSSSTKIILREGLSGLSKHTHDVLRPPARPGELEETSPLRCCPLQSCGRPSSLSVFAARLSFTASVHHADIFPSNLSRTVLFFCFCFWQLISLIEELWCRFFWVAGKGGADTLVGASAVAGDDAIAGVLSGVAEGVDGDGNGRGWALFSLRTAQSGWWCIKSGKHCVRHTEPLDSCFNLISYQQCITWSPQLKIEPATTECSEGFSGHPDLPTPALGQDMTQDQFLSRV